MMNKIVARFYETPARSALQWQAGIVVAPEFKN
jgi:hypothetical protein